MDQMPTTVPPIPAPPSKPPVDRMEQQDQPARTRFITFALIGGAIACILFLITFLTSLRAQTPPPYSNLRLSPIPTPLVTVPTPRARTIPSPQPVEVASNSGTQIPVTVETPLVPPTTELETSPSAGI